MDAQAPRMPGQLATINGARHAEREAARADAWELRVAGFSQSAIAERLEVSVSTVAAYLRETLEELKSSSLDSADAWRKLELARLEAVISTWLPVSSDPSHPEAARGGAIVIRAVEAQSRLMGLLQTNLIIPGEGRPEASSTELLAKSPALRAAMRRQLDEAERLSQEATRPSTSG
jgi:transcriptional regulator with XRE-family HTH domain